MRRHAVLDATLLSRVWHCGLVGVLPLLFARIHVPPEVRDEVVRAPGGEWLLQALTGSEPFLRLCVERDSMVEELLSTQIDLGEAAVIAQAEYHQLRGVDLVAVTDDARALRSARLQQLKPMRSGRLLIELKANGLIPDVRLYLDRLQRLGFHLRPSHRRKILEAAGEV